MKRKASNLDELIGKKIERRRKFLGYTVSSFAKKIGVSAQQLYKYETGVNRISASALKEISEILNVSLDHFFSSSLSGLDDSKGFVAEDLFLNGEDLVALRAYFLKISDTKARATIIRVAKVMAQLSYQQEERRAAENSFLLELAN